jgi:hypothetical protein
MIVDDNKNTVVVLGSILEKPESVKSVCPFRLAGLEWERLEAIINRSKCIGKFCKLFNVDTNKCDLEK